MATQTVTTSKPINLAGMILAGGKPTDPTVKTPKSAKQAKKDAKQARKSGKAADPEAVKTLLVQTADTIVGADKQAGMIREDARLQVETLLKSARAAGLKSEDTYKKGEYYPLLNGKFDAMRDSTRYNCMTAIRNFLKELEAGKRSAKLDLWGNFARDAKKQAAAKKATGNATNAGQGKGKTAPAADAGTPGVQSQKEGAAALTEILTHWANKNAADASLFHLLKMARDLAAEAAKHSAKIAAQQPDANED